MNPRRTRRPSTRRLHPRRLGVAATVLALALSACSWGEANPPAEGRPVSAYVPSERAAGEPLVVVAVGDIACESGDRTTPTTCQDKATAKLAKSLSPDLVLALGDEQYQEGTLADFRSEYDASWGALKSITKPIPGNHEYRTAGASGYYTYFADQDPGRGYYRFRTAGWSFYALNSNCGELDCAAQREWLKKASAEDPNTCALAYWHHPRYSSGEHGSQTWTRPFWRIVDRAGVDVVLAGHDHHYERFGPRNAINQARQSGPISFVSGAGGKSHYPVSNPVAGSRAHVDDVFGVLRLELTPDSVAWSWHGIDGSVLDEGQRACR